MLNTLCIQNPKAAHIYTHIFIGEFDRNRLDLHQPIEKLIEDRKKMSHILLLKQEALNERT